MTRMPQIAPLPRGLLWVITPDAAGNLVLCISQGLTCQQRRAALRAYEKACGQGRSTLPGPPAAWGTAAIIALVGALAALLAFSGAPPSARARPAGSVSPAPVRSHHARRREDGIPAPRPLLKRAG
jgi:hypothetical protein